MPEFFPEFWRDCDKELHAKRDAPQYRMPDPMQTRKPFEPCRGIGRSRHKATKETA